MNIRRPLTLFALTASTAFGQGPPQGQWEDVFDFGPTLQDRIVAIHLLHVYDPYTGSGKVVAINRYHYVLPPSPCYAPEVRYWTPPAANDPPGFPGTFESIPNWRTDVFCSGHSALADGRILTVGGHFGCHIHADIFEPFVSPASAVSWIVAAQMNWPRWYPTATTLPSGWVLATGSKGPNGAQDSRRPDANARAQAQGASRAGSAGFMPWPELQDYSG